MPLRGVLLSTALATALAACEKPDEPTATAVVMVSGNRQEGLVATALSQPLVVKVSDQYGNPVANANVTFTVTSGDGSVTPATVATTATGTASAVWTLGTAVGTQAVAVAATGIKIASPVEFSATAVDQTISGTVTISPLGELAELGMGPSRAPDPLPALRSSRASDPAFARDHVPGEFLVTFTDEAIMPGFSMSAVDTRQEAEPVMARMRQLARGLVPDTDFTILRASAPLRYVVIRAPSDAEAVDMMARLRKDPRVESVEWNGIQARPMWQAAPFDRNEESMSKAVRPEGETGGPLVANTVPNDPLAAAQAWHYDMIDVARAWERQRGASAVTVAVIDDGSVPDHQDMSGVYTTDGYNFVSWEPTDNVPPCAAGTTIRHNPAGGRSPDPRRLNDWVISSSATCWEPSTGGGHGLHVAGTIAALAGNGIGGYGIAAGVRIRAIKVFGDKDGFGGTWDDIAQAILYAAGLPAIGAGNVAVQAPRSAIVNMSLGGYGNSTVLRNAISAAADAGTLLVASAGNDGTTFGAVPASLPGVLSVVSLGPDGNPARYSNGGAAAAIAAPGGDFYWNTSTTGVLSTVWNFSARTSTYSYYQGTSMAAPHVAGVAALLLSQDPGQTASALRDRLLQFSLPLLGPQRSDAFGFGFLNAATSLLRSRTRGERTQLRLVNAATGDTVRSLLVTPGTAFTMTRVPDGRYWLLASQDRDNDGAFGATGRRFGAAGSASAPREITVGNRVGATANIMLGFNVETEPNDDLARANRLFVNSSVVARFDAPDPNDTYVVQIPRAGTYVFEAGAVFGACGFGLELDGLLQLLDNLGNVVASNDDIGGTGVNRFCSRITQALQPGTFHLRVTNSPGVFRRWRYRLSVTRTQ